MNQQETSVFSLYREHPAHSKQRRICGGLAVAFALVSLCNFSLAQVTTTPSDALQRLKYNNPDLIVDLGVGLWAWPMPMDYDHDGDLDLVVVCPDKPYEGTYFFENKGQTEADDHHYPVFEPGVRVASAVRNSQVSYLGDEARPVVTTPGTTFTRFHETGFEQGQPIGVMTEDIHSTSGVRANQWKWCDWDGDGKFDLLVGIGDWEEYGWDNAFNAAGEWTRGPLHGYVYWLRNVGDDKDEFADPVALQAGGQRIDGFGMPSPNAADFDGDGDLDLMCGEFLDGFTYYENVGTRTAPQLAAGRRLRNDAVEIRMDLQMIVPVAIDWDRDGDTDLIVGDEDGRVAWIEHTGNVVDGMPQFQPPHYFQQRADELKFGALVTPVSFDWDGDGDEDLICGNTAGYIGFIENLDGGDPPRWAAPQRLEADGKVLRIQAGSNGSIQGPCEAKWGYTTLDVADWNNDRLPDLIVNSIWGRVVWYRNVGTRQQPRLSFAGNIKVAWRGTPPKPAWTWWEPEPDQLATQWRTTPTVIDWNGDGWMDLMMLDHEGYLSYFERDSTTPGQPLKPGQRIFQGDGPSQYDSGHRVLEKRRGVLRLNGNSAGKSGRRKLCWVDWDQDGKLELLVNSQNVNLLRLVEIIDEGQGQSTYLFHDAGPFSAHVLAGHTTSPTTVDWDGDGLPALLIGAEDGYFYYVPR